MEDIYPTPATGRRWKYLLVFDPLDGSSNIERYHRDQVTAQVSASDSLFNSHSLFRGPWPLCGVEGPG